MRADGLTSEEREELRRKVFAHSAVIVVPLGLSAFRKRETFAYACEAYGRIIELAQRSSHPAGVVEELAAGPLPNDQRVDGAEYLDIVREAAASRNGWRRILARCAPRKAVRAPANVILE